MIVFSVIADRDAPAAAAGAAPHRVGVSREATFLFNNLLFVALAFAILWGVALPDRSPRRCGAQTVLGSSPFYDFFAVVFGLPLLLLAGIGPVVAWRRASRAAAVARAFLWPFLSAAAAAVLLVARGATGRASPASSRGQLCLFVVV